MTIIQVPRKYRIANYPFRYPPYAPKSFNLERLIHAYLKNKNFERNSFHYLPVYWTTLHTHNNYGHNTDILKELRAYVKSVCDRYEHVFTYCQYDDGPLVEHSKLSVYLGSRKVSGLDGPLLSSKMPRRRSFNRSKKKYIASFSGRLQTHPLRTMMKDSCKKIERVYITEQHLKPKEYSSLIKDSIVALAPRGYGGSSFRFYEAMQLGTAPVLLGDYDVRPFKHFIDWDSCSYYFNSSEKLADFLASINIDTAVQKGFRAREIYKKWFLGEAWVDLMIKDMDARIGLN